MVIAIIAVLLGLLLSGVQKVRDTSLRLSCQNRMRQLGLSLHQYHDQHSTFPSGFRHYVLLPGVGSWMDPEPYPLMTWHTFLLPYVEQEAIWRETTRAYALDRYFLNDPPHSEKYRQVANFLCPADSLRSPSPYGSGRIEGLTSYLGVEGVTYQRQSGMLFLDSATRFGDVLDGTSNTVFVGERPPGRYGARGRWAGGWGAWGNADSTLGVRENFVVDPLCPPGPHLFRPDRIDDDCAVYHFWSLHTGGANFLFVDGSVRFLPYSAADILPALATRDGGEVQSVP